MNLKAMTLAALVVASPAFAEIKIVDAYARAASPSAKSGAAFMEIINTGAEDDRLIAAASEVAARVELHTHKDMGDGVMKMMEVEEGFAVPAGGHHMLARGGDHVMMMGLTGPLEQGATVTVTLTFEQAGEMVVEIPVDNERMPGAMDHGEMDHSGHGN
ncbi:copper chaperone PCu(A)C [Vannielia litorea]|uniref:copper chaperone PCu(A)C n=1 Tax=Vannielia litorea TaxID=1217970 RepID=UPI001C96E027|nr:copper chaperone PCu(A)C [Vannielia litorea]MBY6048035.1 copper chaperone PCu(A)C [Vannielia litorea]MBY6075449.1 copper chaperone PCu(A)C [Vannielia litorea]